MWAVAAALLGAIWRRWWGDERPTWAKRLDGQVPWKWVGGFPLRVGIQAPTGVATLLGLGLLTGEVWWRAGLDAIAAIAWLSIPIKVSLVGFTQFWRWVDERVVSLKGPHRLIDGYTTYAEATGGAAVFALAVLI